MSQNCHVLLVEDEDLLRETIEDYLLMEGFEVTSVASGYAALDVFNHQDFDLILSDIKMPNGSGVDLLKAVREKKPGTPPYIVMMSGYSEYEWEDLKSFGADDFLVKPFDIDLMSEKIKSLCQ